MKLLVLGGTVFLGRHVVEAARARGHEVTIFTRGRHNPDLFPQVERLRGDRDTGELTALAGREWHAVVDTSGYVPRVARDSAQTLASSVGHYTFVSSISVYRDFRRPGYDETAQLATVDDPSVEEVTGETYGALKALCEEAVEEELPGRAAHVRAGLIVGPQDQTNRFTYWVTRIADGGTVLAPEPRHQPTQLVDVRDLADWIVRLGEERTAGVFNATGPGKPTTLEGVLEEIRTALGSDARLEWVSEEFARGAGLEPYQGLPLWVGESEPEWAAFQTADIRRALEAGLRFRPLAETARDTLEWAREGDAPGAKDVGVAMVPAGITRERERDLLAAWRAREAA